MTLSVVRNDRHLPASDPVDFIGNLLFILGPGLFIIGPVLSIAGYYIASRRPGHTRANLVAGAVVGGGLSGALVAAFVAVGSASFSDALPWALIGLSWGAIVGLCGVLARALGGWLGRRP